ncbi:MAG: RecX family transcriptional regulator [Aeromicrobium sp.]|nr:RecX family transcriptional regulator [Aeromicrobium sp.]
MGADPRTVTEIRATRGTVRRALYLDGELWAHVPAPVLRVLGLRAGDVVDPEAITAQVASLAPGAARERAYRLLAYRERCSAEVRDRLARDGYSADVVGPLVDDLVRAGSIDDARFARSRATALVVQRGFGRRRALMTMVRDGIDENRAVEELDALVPESAEAERAMREASRRSRPGDSVQRLAARLVRRGFAPGDALRAAQATLDEEAGTDAI